MYTTKNGKSSMTVSALLSIFEHRMKQAEYFTQLAAVAKTEEERARHLNTVEKATAYAMTARRRADKKHLDSLFSHPKCK